MLPIVHRPSSIVAGAHFFWVISLTEYCVKMDQAGIKVGDSCRVVLRWSPPAAAGRIEPFGWCSVTIVTGEVSKRGREPAQPGPRQQGVPHMASEWNKEPEPNSATPPADFGALY